MLCARRWRRPQGLERREAEKALEIEFLAQDLAPLWSPRVREAVAQKWVNVCTLDERH